ncbi:MAG: PKD domain-containing protein [Bacteroidota bacterium]
MMKISTKYLGCILFSICLLSCSVSTAQVDIRAVGAQNVNNRKAQGLLTGAEKYSNSQAQPQNARIALPPPHEMSALCNCWIDRDASWQIGQFDYQGGSGGPGVAPDYRNDDWSTDAIVLPFNFCFYGQTVNSVYLNNNGNISIGATYATFTANSFPSANYVMIAPFWADVDTRGALSGLVYYEVTPTHAIFQWENVGYYGIHDDLLNTFQLIITDGNDTIIPPGDNVSFCYKDMQWTTGDASSGVGGFGGTPATVGINQGNGTDYIQVGLYDQAGAAWDGPYGANDGIDALDNQSYFFNCCFSNSNIPPIIRSTAVCDTLRLCVGDTILIEADFLSPEVGQITTAAVNTNGVNGVNVLQQTAGNTAHIQIQIIADASNIGYNTIYLIGTDNGVPAQVTSIPIIFNVQPSPTAAATFIPPSPITPGTVVTFTNTSTGLFSNWDFDDGTTSTTRNPVHTFNNPGTYYVTLVSMNPNGCTDTLVMQIDVISCVLVNIVTAATACAGDPISFTYTGNASGAAVYNWNFGSGTIVSGANAGPINVVWNTAGNYNVSITVSDNGCTSTPVNVPVTVNANPVASFTSTPSICEGDTTPIAFNGTSIAGATYNWYFQNGSVVSGSGQGPVNVSWAASGNDSIGLIVSQNGCTDTVSNYLLVNPAPTSVFNVGADVCVGSDLTVTYSGTGTAGATYNWNFGTGTIASGSGQGPYSISWPLAGATSVTLTVTENGCVSPPTNIPLNVNASPVAAINGTPSLCAGDQNVITFTGSASGTATYNWNFGSATVISGSGAGPYTLSWPNAVNDNITLTVDDNGCTDNTTFAVAVNPIPNSPFILPASVCAGNDVNISYTGSATSGATYNWNFAGGIVVSGSGQGPYVINWNAPGNPQVTLSVTENGCTSPVSNNAIAITAGPVAAFTATPALCLGIQNNVNFTGSAGGTAAWNWNFGSATVLSGTGSGPYTLDYPNAGNYNINLIISDNGCADTATFTVVVNPIPTSTFTLPPSVCDGVPITINYTGTGTGASNYAWTFGGGTVISGSGAGPYSVSWSAAGNPNVTLSVSENGCVSPLTNNAIVINAHPVAVFTGTPVLCTGVQNTITFTGSASATATYTWNFGSATIISGSNEGPYELEWSSAVNEIIHLTVSENGCSDTTSFAVLVNAMPVSNFLMQPSVCVGDEVTVSFTGVALGNANYNWSFGGATIQSGTGAGPYTLVWNTPGNPNVSLTVSQNGCVSPLATDQILVAPYPAAIAGSDAIVCSGIGVPVGFSPEVDVIYQWSPVNDLVDPTSSSTTVATNNSTIVTQTTTYTLTAINTAGCVTTDAVEVTVNPIPVLTFTTGAQCFEGNSFGYSAGGNLIPGATYSWSFGPGATPASSADQVPVPVIYDAPGTYPVTLNAVYNNCVAAPYTDSAVVFISPVADFYPLVVEGCEPLQVPTMNLSTGDDNSYNWTFTDASESGEETPTHTFQHAGTYSISLQATTQNGCVDVINLENIITVFPTPVANFTPQPAVTTIWEPLIRFDNFTTHGDVYSWTFGDSTTSEIFRPDHEYKDTGTFEIVLYVQTYHGCVDTIRGTVRIEYGYTFYVPNAFTPDGNGGNNFFQGYGTSVEQYEMHIFDRWGKNIFTTESYFRPWDGTFNGVPVQPDVYVYKIKVLDSLGKHHEYVGRVSVVR